MIRPHEAQVHAFLQEVDADFPIPLSQKQPLEALAHKFSEYATMCAEFDGDRIVAATFGYTDNLVDDIAYISVVATAPSHRGNGLARRTVQAFLDVCKLKGVRAAHLYTEPENVGAIALYESLGFDGYRPKDERRPESVHLIWRDEEPVQPINILFTSAGRRSYLVEYFRQALNGAGQVHAANSSAISPALEIADAAVVSPLIYDEGYIDFLLDYCRQNDIQAIIPLFDVDVPVIAANRARFEKIGCTPVVASEATARICNDKWQTYCWLKDNGFSAPVTFLAVEDALAAVDAGKLTFPLMVKPRWGMGSIGVYRADTADELRVLFEKTRRDVFASYLKYESAATQVQPVVVQECLTGTEYGLDVICDLQGRYRHTVVKEKLAMRSGETDCAITVDDAGLRDVGKRLAQTLRHPGNLDVDVFVDGERTCVLELNARFGGGYPFSHAAGVDVPRAIVGWLRGIDVPDCLFGERLGVMAQKDIAIVELKGVQGS